MNLLHIIIIEIDKMKLWNGNMNSKIHHNLLKGKLNEL